MSAPSLPPAQAQPAHGSPAATRRAAWLIVGAAFLFAAMSVCVKLASASYGAAEIVFYRSLMGVALLAAVARWQRQSLKTTVPWMHAWRSVVGVASLFLWFYAMAGLPLATAVTLNYMSSVWMALFLIGGAVMLGASRVDARLVLTVLVGFAGVALILQPTIEQNQAWHGLAGLLSGMLAALAYLQVTALGRVGEPETRVVFYFSVGGVLAGAALSQMVGWRPHTLSGVAWLALVGLLATAAQLMMTRAYAIGSPLVNASLQYLGIAFAFGFGVLVFDDPVTAAAIGGMLLVVGAGLAAVRLRSDQAPADASRQAPDA